MTLKDIMYVYKIARNVDMTLVEYFMVEVAYNHLKNHSGYINSNNEAVCDYDITLEYIIREIKERIAESTLPAMIYFLAKGGLSWKTQVKQNFSK